MPAAVEDAGRYTCIVSNSAGEERKNFNLDILGKEITNILYFHITFFNVLIDFPIRLKCSLKVIFCIYT